MTATMADKNRVRPDSSFPDTPLGKATLASTAARLNRGGRPRKDGSRADDGITLKELGLTKRMAADARLYASVSDEVFEAALNKRGEAMSSGKRVPSLRSLLPDRRANSRREREMMADISRIVSTARRIVKATEFDPSPKAETLRSLAQATIDLWSEGLIGVVARERI